MSLIGAHGLMMSTSGASGYAATILALPSLWGYWKLDENSPASGASVSDSSSNARNGTYVGTWVNATALFAGSSMAKTAAARITLPDYTVASTPKFSLCGFVSSTSTGATSRSILGADNGSTNRRWQFRMVNGQVQFIFITPSNVTVTSTATINDGNPHFVCAVYDESLSAGAGRLKLYIDGSLDTSTSTSVTMTPGTANVSIGSRSNASTLDSWVGQFDEMFIVDDAISSAQVSALWSARNTP